MNIHKEAYEALRSNILCKIDDGWDDISLTLVLDMIDNHLSAARQRVKEWQEEEGKQWNDAEDRQQKEWGKWNNDPMREAIADRRDLDAGEIK